METLWRASWQGALFAFVVWILCRLWRKMPASVACAMWLFVCVKLLAGLCPLAFSLPVLPAEKMVTLSLPAEARLIPILPDDGSPQTVPELTPVAYGFLIWLAGVTVLVLFILLALGRLRKLLQSATPITNPAFRDLAREMGLRRVPRLLETDKDIEVLTVGAFRPCVLVSRSMLGRCSAEEMRLVWAHELAHLKRRDAWFALLPQAATILFFFHPAAWLAAREFELAREAACDEIAMRRLSVGSEVYGRLLLKVGTRREFAGSYFVMGISSHFRALSRRIAMLNRLSSDSKPRRTLAIVGLIGTMFVMPWTLVHAQGPSSDPLSKPLSSPPATSDPISRSIQRQPASQKARFGYKVANMKPSVLAMLLRSQFPQKSLTITGDDRKKILSGSGPDKLLEQVVERAQQLDKQASNPTTLVAPQMPKVTVSPAPGGDAKALAIRIARGLKSKYPLKAFKVLADIGDNVVLVYLNPRIQKEATKWLKQIEAEGRKSQPKTLESEETLSMRVRYVSAAEVAATLNEMLAKDPNSPAGAITADSRTNVINFRGPRSFVLTYSRWIDRLDKPSEGRPGLASLRQVKSYALAHIDAVEAAKLLRDKFPGIERISADQRTNSVMVFANVSDIEEIERQIQAIDHAS